MESLVDKSKLLPFSCKYQCVDKRYRFSKRGIHNCLYIDYPLSEPKYQQRWPTRRRTPRPGRSSSPTVLQLTKKVLPDVVLLNIFKYIHPIDLVNGISKVSKRWNALAKAPSLYRYVRVLVNKQSPNSESTNKFLQRISNHVRKLCVVFEEDVFFDVFPDCMPNVTFLDIAYFPDLDKSAEKLISCFRCVEVLNLYYVRNINDNVVNTLFANNCLKRLRQLHFISMDGKPSNFIRKLCESERPLQLLNVPYSFELRELLVSPIRNTLTELYVNEYFDESTYAVIGQLINLTTLSIFSSLYGTDEQLMQLKSLCKLEHLHLDCCGPDCDMSPDAVAHFFELPLENAANYFPYRLKYLRLSDCYSFKLAAADALVKSCPQLLSINVARDCYMGEETLTLLAKNLKNLRFLDISDLGGMRCDALCTLSDDDLPQLRFLQLHRTRVTEEVLWALNLKRPHLMITNRHDYFINWDIRDGKPHLNGDFEGDMNRVLNDLEEVDGFCCMCNPVLDYYE